MTLCPPKSRSSDGGGKQLGSAMTMSQVVGMGTVQLQHHAPISASLKGQRVLDTFADSLHLLAASELQAQYLGALQAVVSPQWCSLGLSPS